MASKPPLLVIVQRVLPHYRIPFFSRLRQVLKEHGVDMLLVYGQERAGSVPRTTDIDASWAIKVRNCYLTVGKLEAVWQPVFGRLKGASLVVIEQANRLLVNYPILILRALGRLRVAYWGHGTNFQGRTSRLRCEALRRLVTTNVDWWFAYTESSARIVKKQGFPSNRITVVQNTIDTSELVSMRDRIGAAELDSLRQELGVSGADVAVYCGGLYKAKRVNFLLDACSKVKERLHDFHLIVIGDGPERAAVEKFAREHRWCHYVGEKTGGARVPYCLLARTMLMPGVVGLAAVDSFVLRTPMVTTQIAGHGPEFVYLKDRDNCLVSANSVDAYATAVVELLSMPHLHSHLNAGCRTSAELLTIEKMVEAFSAGVRQCIGERVEM